MSILQTVTTSCKIQLLQAVHNFGPTSPNTFKIALYTAAADLNASTTIYSTSNEVSSSGTGYTAGGNTLVISQSPTSGPNSNAVPTAYISFANVYTQFLEDIDKQMMQNAGDVIAIQPVYNTKIKKQIAEAYSNNLKLYIKDFTDDKIVALRQYLQPLILENGYRSEVLQEYLTKSFNVNKAKAKFLARQESSLLMTSYTEARYQSEGIREFIWSSSGDSRVRPEHKLLNGKKFSFNNLPVIDSKTGERGLPGHAFGCRCRMKPVVNI